MQIVFAFCDNKCIICSDREIEDTREMLKDSEEFQCYAVNEEIETEMIRYFILDEKLKDFITTSHSNEIEYHISEISSSLSD